MEDLHENTIPAVTRKTLRNDKRGGESVSAVRWRACDIKQTQVVRIHVRISGANQIHSAAPMAIHNAMITMAPALLLGFAPCSAIHASA